MARTTSAAGRAAITQREGCILHAYLDSVGVPTIGVGHTGRMAPPKVAIGQRITAAQSDAFLAADLSPVDACIARCVVVETSQNEHDAMASLAFNIGTGGFAGSTVVHKLNADDRAGAADAFLMWVHPSDLAMRRKAERAQFLRPDAPIAASASVPTAGPAHTEAAKAPPLTGWRALLASVRAHFGRPT